LDANINRSPSAYLNNPAEERARYQFDQDKDLTLLRFDDTSGKARGFLSFFAVHGTSLYEVCVMPLDFKEKVDPGDRTTPLSAATTKGLQPIWLKQMPNRMPSQGILLLLLDFLNVCVLSNYDLFSTLICSLSS